MFLIVGFLLAGTSCSSDNKVSAFNNEQTQSADENLPYPETPQIAAEGSLQAFKSTAELKQYFALIAKETGNRRNRSGNMAMPNKSAAVQDNASGSSSQNEASKSMEAPSASSSSKDESITNTQHAGVDEGGIVKLYGNYLVVLRRGRLFSVSVNANKLTPISKINVYQSKSRNNNQGIWYDEMLISGNTITVIGYNYAGGGTEVALFNINNAGEISYNSTYHLKSNDYYSSENYASRLIGSKLIFYTPIQLDINSPDPMKNFPAIKKWNDNSNEYGWIQTSSPQRTYRPIKQPSDFESLTLHTVTTCELANVTPNSTMKCESTAVIGPEGRVFYVAASSVYVWVTNYDWQADSVNSPVKKSVLYRLPLSGAAVSALQVSGSPVNQFSFNETADGYLNVLVRSESAGDGMWKSKMVAGDTALMRIGVSKFSDGRSSVANSNYHVLPTVSGYAFENRFVGNYLLYGGTSSADTYNHPYPDAPTTDHPEIEPSANLLYIVRYADGLYKRLNIQHNIERIEPMGDNAVVVGKSANNLYISPIRVSLNPSVMNPYVRRNASESESRSHSFFYKPETNSTGTLGLPILSNDNEAYNGGSAGAASILYIRNENLSFNSLGDLKSSAQSTTDNCQTSCVDWYGNAQPLFLKNRVFALLGYEIIEGQISNGRINETNRVNYFNQTQIRNPINPRNPSNTRVVDGWTTAPTKENN